MEDPETPKSSRTRAMMGRRWMSRVLIGNKSRNHLSDDSSAASSVAGNEIVASPKKSPSFRSIVASTRNNRNSRGDSRSLSSKSQDEDETQQGDEETGVGLDSDDPYTMEDILSIAPPNIMDVTVAVRKDQSTTQPSSRTPDSFTTRLLPPYEVCDDDGSRANSIAALRRNQDYRDDSDADDEETEADMNIDDSASSEVRALDAKGARKENSTSPVFDDEESAPADIDEMITAELTPIGNLDRTSNSEVISSIPMMNSQSSQSLRPISPLHQSHLSLDSERPNSPLIQKSPFVHNPDGSQFDEYRINKHLSPANYGAHKLHASALMSSPHSHTRRRKVTFEPGTSSNLKVAPLLTSRTSGSVDPRRDPFPRQCAVGVALELQYMGQSPPRSSFAVRGGNGSERIPSPEDTSISGVVYPRHQHRSMMNVDESSGTHPHRNVHDAQLHHHDQAYRVPPRRVDEFGGFHHTSERIPSPENTSMSGVAYPRHQHRSMINVDESSGIHSHRNVHHAHLHHHDPACQRSGREPHRISQRHRMSPSDCGADLYSSDYQGASSRPSFRPVATGGETLGSFDQWQPQSRHHASLPGPRGPPRPPPSTHGLFPNTMQDYHNQGAFSGSNSHCEGHSGRNPPRRGQSIRLQHHRVSGGSSGSSANMVESMSAHDTEQLEEKMLRMAMERSLEEFKTQGTDPLPPVGRAPPTDSYGEHIVADESNDTDLETARRLAEIEQEQEMLEIAIQQSLEDSGVSLNSSLSAMDDIVDAGEIESGFQSPPRFALSADTVTPSSYRGSSQSIRRVSLTGSMLSLVDSSNNGDNGNSEDDDVLFDEHMRSTTSVPLSIGQESPNRPHPYLASPEPSTPPHGSDRTDPDSDLAVAPSVVRITSPPRVHPLEAASMKQSNGPKY